MPTGRLHGRIRSMGQQQRGTADAAADNGSAGAPGRRQRAGTQPATGTASPGGTPSQMPAGGLQPVTSTGSSARGAVAKPNGGGAASPPGPQVMPLQAVVVGPVLSQYVTLGAVDLVPLVTADGAMVPATAPGRWNQLRAAGRP